MKAAVIVFPGSNCDRDVARALHGASGEAPLMVWHGDGEVPNVDLIVLPGGFSYGDYLRCGAMAAHSPVMRDVVRRAKAGTPVLGICNGFQILCEAGLLPGVLMRNSGLAFICRDVTMRVERNDTVFTRRYHNRGVVTMPIAHAEGLYFTDADTLRRLEGEQRIAFRYSDGEGRPVAEANPNGALNSIAGLFDETGRILGLMPHPERLADPLLGGMDGRAMFEGLVEALG